MESSNHSENIEDVESHEDDADFECSLCDFKSSSETEMVQHSEAHENEVYIIDEPDNSDTGNVLQELAIGKELVVELVRLDMTLIDTPEIKFPWNYKPLVKEERTYVEDYSDDESNYESNKIMNEIAEAMISRETEFYNKAKEYILNEDNYVDCPFGDDCYLMLYVEHIEIHYQAHETGYTNEISKEEKNTRKFLCAECGRKYPNFKSFSNHIFDHFKEKNASKERVCSACGYKSKRLSSFKIHKCDNVKVDKTNISETLQHIHQSVTNNELISMKHRKVITDKEYNPSDNSDKSNESDDSSINSDTADGSDDSSENSDKADDSDDSDYQLPKEKKVDKDSKRMDKKLRNSNNSQSYDKKDSESKSKNIKYNVKRKYNNDDSFANFKVTCTRCNDQFDNIKLFNYHLKKNKNNCNELKNLKNKEVNEFGVRFLCLKCNKNFKHNISLKKHINTHHSIIKYHCDQCEFLSEKNIFMQHMNAIHGKSIGMSTCPTCNKTYVTKAQLERHMFRMHPSDQDQKLTSLCNICGKVYSSRRLAEHMLIHRAEKPFPCKLCEFSTAKKYNLDVHMKAHEKKGSVVYMRTQKRKNIEN